MASQQTVITWNIANWVTVTLMALIGVTAVRLIFEFFNRRNKNGDT